MAWFRPNALNAYLRSIIHCNFYVPLRAEEAGKLHRLATFALRFLLLHPPVCQVLFQYIAALKEGGCQVRQTDGV